MEGGEERMGGFKIKKVGGGTAGEAGRAQAGQRLDGR